MSSPTLTGVLAEILRDSNNVEHRQALKQAIDLVDPTLDSDLTVMQLENQYTGSNGWGEHPDWPRQVWREDVINENTQCGYWEWVFNNIQNEGEPS